MKASIEKPQYVNDDIFNHIISKTRSQLKILNNAYKNEIQRHSLFISISDIVCSYFNTTLDEMRMYHNSRKTEFKKPRQILAYFLVEYLYPKLMSKLAIAEAMGYNHATVIYHHEEVKSQLEICNREYVKIINEIGSEIDKLE